MTQLGPAEVGQIYEYLKAAQNPQPETQKASEAALRSLESKSGFCSCLAEVIRNKQADHSARWLAAIHLKNVIGRSWKARPGQSCISDGEKAYLRQTLMQLIDQESSQIVLPIAVCFAKMARVDYPSSWPSLFQDLMACINSGDVLRARRAYLILHHIIKELASMRLPAHVQTFAKVSELLIQPYWNQWCSDTQTLLQGLGRALGEQQHQGPLTFIFERWFLLLKAITRMIVFGQTSDARTVEPIPAVMQMLPTLLAALKSLHAARPAGEGSWTHLQAMLDRALTKLAQKLLSIQECHPWSFCRSSCFHEALEFFATAVVSRLSSSASYERFLTKCMAFLHGVLICKAYRGVPEAVSGSQMAAQAAKAKEVSQAVLRDLTTFWEAGNAKRLCRAAIELYLPLSVKELQEWEDSPEEYHQQAEIGAWQDSLRLCAETLYVTFLEKNRTLIAPAVIELLQAGSAACPPGQASSLPGPRRRDIPLAVLAKEAVYSAVGAGAWDLMDYIEFSPWLRSALLPEIADRSRENRPLRRRAVILIGQWVSRLTSSDRPEVYRAALEVLAEDDFALSLAAVGCLNDLVGDWEFVESAFVPFLPATLQQLARLLHAADHFESQLQVFNLVNLIFDRLAESVRPHVGTILQLLPDLWQSSADSSLLRIQIILSVQRVINALGSEMAAVNPILIPILEVSTNPNEGDALNLLEDGLQLWLVALRNCPEPQATLLNLFPNLIATLHSSTEQIRSAAQIIVSMALLGGREFLALHGQRLVEALTPLIGHLTERGMLMLLPVLEVIIQVVPAEGPALLQPALERLLRSLQEGRESSIVIAGILSVFARVLLHSPEYFSRFFQSLPQVNGRLALEGFVGLWMDAFDSIGSQACRKLSAMALCMLLGLPGPWIPAHASSIIANLTFSLSELDDNGVEAEFGFHGWYQAFQGGPDTSSPAVAVSEDASGEYLRKAALHKRDPVNRIKLRDFVPDQLRRAAALHGAESLSNALSTMDPAVLAPLQRVMAQQ